MKVSFVEFANRALCKYFYPFIYVLRYERSGIQFGILKKPIKLDAYFVYFYLFYYLL